MTSATDSIKSQFEEIEGDLDELRKWLLATSPRPGYGDDGAHNIGGNVLGNVIHLLDRVADRQWLLDALSAWIEELNGAGTAPLHLCIKVVDGADAEVHTIAVEEGWTRQDWAEWQGARDELRAYCPGARIGASGHTFIVVAHEVTIVQDGGECAANKPMLRRLLALVDQMVAGGAPNPAGNGN